MIDLATGELAPLYGTAAVACGNRREAVCPACSAGVQARRPPARPRGPGRRQGHPRDDHRAPVRVRHPHRPLLRAGPRPPDARQDRPALPTPPRRQDAPLPARPRHLLPDPARRDRPPARPAHVPGLLRLRSRRAVQRLRGGPVAPVRHLPAPAPGPAGRGITQKTLRARLRIRFVKVAEYQARGVVHFHAVIRLDAPGEDYQPPPPGITADLLCDAIGQAAAAVRLVIDHDGQAVALGFGAADRHPDHPARRRAARHRPGRSTARPWPTTSPSTPPRPSAAPGLPSLRIRREADIEQLRCPAHYRRHDHRRLAARQHPATTPGSGPGRTCSATAATS